MKDPERLLKLKTAYKDARVFFKTVGIISSGNRALFCLSCATNLLFSQFPAVLAYLSKMIVDALVAGGAIPGPLGSVHGPIFLGFAYLLLLIGQSLGQSVLVFINENLTEAVSKNIHLEIIKSAIRLEGLYYFENPEFHNRRSILEREALYIPMNFLRFVNDISSAMLTTLSMAVLLFALHPVIPFLMIAFGLPEVFTQKKSHRLIYEGIIETAREERLKDYYRSVLISQEDAKEVRLYDLGLYFIEKYSASVRRIFEIVLPLRRRQIRRSAFSRLLTSIGTVLPFLWTVEQAVRGNITPGQLAMFMTAIFVVQQQLARAAQTLAGHQDVINVMEELANWLDLKSDLVTIKGKEEKLRAHRLAPLVRIDNLWFRYPGSAHFILRGLDLELMRGKSLAIVGKNGCGKTTLVKLLCRLYDPQEGAIYFDETDIRLLRLDDLRNSTGIIFQDFMRYDLTMAENIALRELADSRAVYEAAARGGVDEFARNLSLAYDTQLGKQFYDGVELSGGQWQRVALARAFFRDAGLLILDEPTASLDINTEARLYAHFKAMTCGKTSLLISHRLSTVRIADHIAVIDGGKVSEFGDHMSLMRLGGLYCEMFTVQAARYQLKEQSAEIVV